VAAVVVELTQQAVEILAVVVLAVAALVEEVPEVEALVAEPPLHLIYRSD
jgi:hypothetical protein